MDDLVHPDPMSLANLEDTTGATDVSSRCPKKPKTHAGDPCNDSNMEVPGASSKSFADAVKSARQTSDEHQYYMGDDDEEPYPGVDDLFNRQNLSEDSVPISGPLLELSKEKYLSLFKP